MALSLSVCYLAGVLCGSKKNNASESVICHTLYKESGDGMNSVNNTKSTANLSSMCALKENRHSEWQKMNGKMKNASLHKIAIIDFASDSSNLLNNCMRLFS